VTESEFDSIGSDAFELMSLERQLEQNCGTPNPGVSAEPQNAVHELHVESFQRCIICTDPGRDEFPGWPGDDAPGSPSDDGAPESSP
jgi:hypothetical protein